jgi:F-type H+-transporting ATPase subunit a
MEHEIWFTALLNKLLGGTVTSLLVKVGLPPANPAHPVPDYVAMELLVILLLLVGLGVLRQRLSVEQPGKFQQAMEVVVQFVQTTADEIIGPEGRRYVAMLGTLGLFIVLCNLLGLVPTLMTPTSEWSVPLGCAVAAFIYYNFHGMRMHGVVGYLKRFLGPILWIAWIMLPVEILSNFARLVSLTARLRANMYAGDLLEQVFGGLVPVIVPVIFMALHVFVSLLQAYIFMLLPAVYISLAVSEEH